MNTKRVIEELRTRHALEKDAPIGLIGSFDTKSSVDLNQRLIRATATTRGIDLVDEVVVPSGIDWSYFDSVKGKVFADHCTDLDHVAGVVRNRQARTAITKDGAVLDGFDVLIHVFDLEKSPYGNDILIIAEEAGIGLSIGFVVLEQGEPTAEEIKRYGNGRKFSSIIRRCRILEISFTCTPCNAQCMTNGAVVGENGKALDLLGQLVAKGRVSKEAAQLFGYQTKAATNKKTELSIKEFHPKREGKTDLSVERKTTAIVID